MDELKKPLRRAKMKKNTAAGQDFKI